MRRIIILLMCAPLFACSILQESQRVRDGNSDSGGASAKAHKSASQKTGKPKKEPEVEIVNFSEGSLKVLKAIYGDDCEISDEAVADLNRKLNNLAAHLCRASSNGLTEDNSLTTGHMQTAVGEVLFGDLIKHAVKEGTGAVEKYSSLEEGSSDNGGEDDISKAAGLKFPVGLAKEYSSHKNIDLESDIYLSAVLEYIAAEIIELSRQIALKRWSSEEKDDSGNDYEITPAKITLQDIFQTIADDEELNTVKERGFL